VIGEIQLALQQGDREALGRAAHKLKGAAANIRAGELARLAASLDVGATTLSRDEVKTLTRALIAERDRAIAFLS
jgi:HPt (histidine-containing phosphotransfer) domain-containing protein